MATELIAERRLAVAATAKSDENAGDTPVTTVKPRPAERA